MSVGVVDKTTGDRIPTAGNPLDKVGNLANLTTTAKGDAVEAINEVNAGLATKQNATDNNLQTTAKEIVPAINEINSNLTSFASLNHLSDTKNLDSDFPLFGLYQGDRLTGTTPYTLTGGTGILVISATSGSIKQQILFDPQNNKISMRTTKYSSSGWYWAAWSTVTLTPVT